MSQAQQMPPAPAPAAPAALAPSTPPQAAMAPAAPAATPIRSTPQLLSWLGTGLVLVSLLVGLVGAVVFSYLAYSLHRAEADAVQLIRVQQIQTNLLGADATATNAFLVGGLEPASQRAAYDQAINTTGALIAEAARAQPADAVALAALNQQVVAYAATIEQARANNRQGFPVGAQYLRTASAELRASALPILDLLVTANSDRADEEMSLSPGYVFIVVAVLGLAATVVAHGWLSRRFKRRINVGVLAGAGALLLALVIGWVGILQIGSTVSAVRTGSFADLNQAAEARIQANDAKANESLTLISRGSGASFEQSFQASSVIVENNLAAVNTSDLSGLWTQYGQTHEKIRSLDDGGSWDQAVALATGAGDDSANTTFNAFDAALASYLDDVSAETANDLGGRIPGLVVLAIVTLLAGLAAGLLSRRGVDARLKEYR